MRVLEIFIDGACSGNPGDAGIGVVVYENGQLIREISKFIGNATNNIAEYTALIFALQEAMVLKAEQVKINTDSQLLYEQLIGHYKVKNANLKVLIDQVQHLAQGFKKLEIVQIPREKNQEADRLATQAIQQERAKVVAPVSHVAKSFVMTPGRKVRAPKDDVSC